MNKLKIAIVYDDNQIYCQIEPDDFRKLLKSSLEGSDIDAALNIVEEKIKQMALRI